MPISQACQQACTLVILAGGQASRMGYIDKGMVNVEGKPMVEHLRERFGPYVKEVWVSCHDATQASRYITRGFDRVVLDSQAEHWGPLAGLEALAGQIHTEYVFVTPCDIPYLPLKVLDRFYAQAVKQPEVGVFAWKVEDKRQPAVLLVKPRELEGIRAFLAQGGRKLGHWLDEVHCHWLHWEGDPAGWYNVNTPRDVTEVQPVVD